MVCWALLKLKQSTGSRGKRPDLEFSMMTNGLLGFFEVKTKNRNQWYKTGSGWLVFLASNKGSILI